MCKPVAWPPLRHDKHGPVEVILDGAKGALGVRAAAVYVDGVPALTWSGGADPASALLPAGKVASDRVRLSRGRHIASAVVWLHPSPPFNGPTSLHAEKCLEVQDDAPSTLGLTVDERGPGRMPWPRFESPLLVDDGI
jgi:hypothetical protein